MGDFITNIVNGWNGLSSGLRDNIIAGIVVALVIGLFTIFRKSIAALVGKIFSKKKGSKTITAAPAPPAMPQPAPPAGDPPPAPQFNPPVDGAGYLSPDQQTLWQIIQDQFNIDELSTDLCVPMNLKPDDVLAGSTLKMKSLSLVTHCRRNNIVVQLRDAVQRARPTLPALPKVSRNTVTRFAGEYIERGKEAAVQQALCSDDGMAAIVGVTAPGGIGKSTLAQVVAERVDERFERLVWQNCGDSSSLDVINTLLVTFVVPTTGNENEKQRLDLLLGALAGQKALIVLDDVRKPNEALLQRFIPPADCAVLATSRMALESSAIPPRHRFDLDAMTDDQARALLAAWLGDELMQKEDGSVSALLKRLKGNALALDLAARSILRNKGMAHPVAAYLRRLNDHLPSMADMPRGDLFVVFAESYEPLDAAMQRCFRHMAVFPPSGGTIAHLAAVWGEDEAQADAALMRLQDAGLVKPVENMDERYRLHDLQDEWALSILRACGEEKEARLAHAGFIIDLFNRHYTDDPSNAPQVLDEWDNLKAASDWAASTGDAETLAKLATRSCNWQYNIFRNTVEWQGWLQKALKLGVADPWLKANTLKAIGDVQQFRDDRDAALQSYNDALALFKAVGANLGEANTLQAIGDVQQFRDDRDAALQSYNDALALFKAVGDKLGEANTLQAIGDVQQFRDDRDAALQSYNDALALFKAVGANLGEANTLKAIGDVQQFRKETNAALQSYNDALALFKAVGDKLGEANTLQAIGDVQQFRKETNAALQSYNDALALFKAVGANLGEANTKLAIARMNDVPALYQEAIALYAQIGDRYSLARGEYFYAVSLDNTPDNRELARKLLTDAREHWQVMEFEPGVSAVNAALAALDAPAEDDTEASS